MNDNANAKAFNEDSSYVLLSALEVWDNNTKTYKKADMFYKRTIKPHKVVERVDTANEALILSISEKAKVDCSRYGCRYYRHTVYVQIL